MKSYLFSITALVLTPTIVIRAGGDLKKDEKPNIIIIYCDDLGYGDLGVTGHPNIKTPNIDKIALSGVRFTNYYSASPASTASRYSLLTGKYPSRSGFGWVLNPNSKRGIHPKEITLAEALKAQQYKTSIFGKWHLGTAKKEYLPLQNGFDEYLGLPYSNDMIPPKWPDIALMNGNDTLELNPNQSKLTELYTSKAISFITENRKENFFVYIPYSMPHVPLHPGKKFERRSKRGAYGDVVEEIDWSVGQILSTLEKQKLDKKTIIWFISDNGPWLIKKEKGGSSGLFRDGKGSTWEGGVRVPCIAYCPELISPSVNDEIITAMDVYATTLWFSGFELPKDHVMDGFVISSYLGYANTAKKKDTPYFYFGKEQKLFAVRLGKWKLHIDTYSQLGIDYFESTLPLLFDLEEDPSEKYNVADKNPEIVNSLTKMIDAKINEIKSAGSFYNEN